jgi:predicted GNAT family acetyltransferase
MSAPRVVHDASGSRFVAPLDEGEGVLSYRRVGERTLDLQHTVVPEAARGRGVGEALVQAAFDHARAHHQRVVPSCPFVAAWLESHPEQEALVATE